LGDKRGGLVAATALRRTGAIANGSFCRVTFGGLRFGTGLAPIAVGGGFARGIALGIVGRGLNVEVGIAVGGSFKP